jgi:SAM-dependent methyltransferase
METPDGTTREQFRRVTVEQFTAHGEAFADSEIINDGAALEALADLAGVTEADKVLDNACGPGIVACDLAIRGAMVTGVDMTPAMLDLARERAGALGIDERVSFVDGAMEKLPFDGGEFSLVVSRYALHHAVSPEEVAAEMSRVLSPTGRIVIVDFAAVDDREAASAYDEAERLRDPSHVRNLTLGELREPFEAIGFGVEKSCSYQLEADLDTVLDASHGVDHPGVRRIYEASLSSHGLGVGARREGGRIVFSYPIAGFLLVRQG